MKTWFRFATLSWIAALLSTPVAVYAQGESASNPAPVGTWVLTVSFAGGNPPPFKEILTLHHGGTVTETNGSLNAASGLLPPPFNLIGSDGQGTWQRMPGGMIGVAFSKIVFCSAASFAFCAPGQEGQQLGYLQVRFQARISGDTLTVDPANSSTVLILGPDPGGPVVDFGSAASAGVRLH